MPCPNCNEPNPPESRFCETCGARLRAAPSAEPQPAMPPACRCGATEFDESGYCQSCGRKQPSGPARERDHKEIVLSAKLAAVTDRGLRHPINEDDVLLALGSNAVPILVVCDGVSSAQNSDKASAVAALAATEALQHPETGDMESAIHAADAAARRIPYLPDGIKDPPGTTLVAAVVQNNQVTVGWTGDSRAYWVTDADAVQLTRDHSWVNEIVDSGAMTEDEALRSRQAHAITRCLGLLNGEEPAAPEVVCAALPPQARLVLCSDGVWNYAPSLEAFAALVRAVPAGADALTVARHLTEFALAQGGRDNITAAVYLA